MLEPRMPMRFEPNVMPFPDVLLVLLILFMFMSMNQPKVLQTQLPDSNARPADDVTPCPIVLAFRAFEVSVTLPTEQFAWCSRSLAPRTCSPSSLASWPGDDALPAHTAVRVAMTAMHDSSLPTERDAGPAMIALSRRYLREYLTKIRLSVSVLDDHVVWARPNDASNSIGNLILHLAGNARQWIVSGVGGSVDVRDRASEFDQRSPIPVCELIDRLEQTIIDVDRVLAGVTPSDLHTRRVIQSSDVSVLEAIYHVVEHFSMHTGQIILLAKANQADRIRFYEMVDGHPRLTSDFHGRTPVHPR